MGLCLEALKESENRSSYPNSPSGPEGLKEILLDRRLPSLADPCEWFVTLAKISSRKGLQTIYIVTGLTSYSNIQTALALR